MFSSSFTPFVSAVQSTAQKLKFSIMDFFSKCDQIQKNSKEKKSLMKNLIFCAVK